MRIIVIGAGQGGLQAARTLANGGAEVTVYEKNSREYIGYDWPDNANSQVFDKLGIALPEESYYFGEGAALVAPFSDKPLQVEVSEQEEKRDRSVERRALSETLVSLAEQAGAKVLFSKPVDALMIENDRVCGVTVCGESITADLIIDSSGALSPFRASLPEKYKVQAMPAGDEVFHAYRAFVAPAEGAPYPQKYPNKVYLKHLGEDGISWCIMEPDGTVNVLVGRTFELSKATLEHALDELRRENPIIGTKILRGGINCTIPIRYPLTRMVANGYAAVGDAAFMTIPMIGSGIANSLRSGQMLAETVLKSKSADIAALWKYQVRYYTEIGAEHVKVDVIKRMLLSCEPQDIRFLFESGVIDKEDMGSISSGEAIVMSPAKIVKKLINGRKNLGALLHLKSAIDKSQKAEQIALTIPTEFDEEKVSEWQKQVDGIFGS